MLDNMCTKSRAALSCLILSGFALVSTAGLAAVERIPEFKLKDPVGNVHTDKELLRGNTVVMISIPNAKHGYAQEHWMTLLEEALPDFGTQIVALQDLSQSDVVTEATEGMEDRFKPGQRPLLLVDTTGDVRRAFGVPDDATTIVVCNHLGMIVHRVSNVTNPDEVQKAVKGVIKAAENTSSVSSAQDK